ncbi:MAG: alanine racemase [Halieaceae bacterium]|jgi:alanine racemase|nr:alanine racemase [Halieaceae bacterium]
MARPNQARLNLAALRNNFGLVRQLAPRSRVIAVVKANAYGHGALTIARELDPLADALAVACIEEAQELRDGGINAPILLLEGLFEAAELSLAAERDFWVTIDNEQQLEWVEQARLPRPIRCLLKLDTGMHRLGVMPEQAGLFHRRLRASPNARDDIVLSTHFASADDTGSDQTLAQLALFEDACRGLPGERSAANSAGVLAWPASHLDWVRPGYMLYGNSPMVEETATAGSLQAVMTLSSAVISLRDIPRGESVGYGATWVASRPSRIATVCVGYGDGYPRLAPSGTPVLVKGRRAPLAGRVSMDMITVDVTELPDVRIGDEVILWGDGLPLGEVARHAGSIGYELTTRMPARTPRIVTSP